MTKLSKLTTGEAIERLLGAPEETLVRMLRQALETRHFRLPEWVDDPGMVPPDAREDVIQGLHNMEPRGPDGTPLRWLMTLFWLAALKEKRRRKAAK